MGEQHRRVGHQKGNCQRDVKCEKRFAGRVAGFALSHAKIVMVKSVQSEIVREVFRRHHQAEGDSAKDVIPTANSDVARTGLLGTQVKVESEEHEEDQQRVFLANAIKSYGIDTHAPESGGQ